MPDWITAAGVGGAVAAAIGFGIRKFVQHELDARLVSIEAELRKQQVRHEAMVKRQMDLLPSLGEVVYRSRNLARDLEETGPGENLLARDELGDLAVRFVEMLYQMRAFLPAQLFDSLHSFKRELQNFVMAYDCAVVEKDDGERSVLLARIADDYRDLDRLHESIQHTLKKLLGTN